MYILNTLRQKILKFLNIKIQKDQKWLIISSLISGVIYALSCAPIQKEIISNLPAEYISIEALWFCLSSLIIGIIWKGCTREKAIRNFFLIALSESVVSFFLACYLVFVRYNVWIFAISTILYASIISTFVGKCIMMFESILWHNKDREDFDNTSSVIRNITACVGFAFATFFMPPIKIAILLWGVGCIFDDIGWIIVYYKNRKQIISQCSKNL